MNENQAKPIRSGRVFGSRSPLWRRGALALLPICALIPLSLEGLNPIVASAVTTSSSAVAAAPASKAKDPATTTPPLLTDPNLKISEEYKAEMVKEDKKPDEPGGLDSAPGVTAEQLRHPAGQSGSADTQPGSAGEPKVRRARSALQSGGTGSPARTSTPEATNRNCHGKLVKFSTNSNHYSKTALMAMNPNEGAYKPKGASSSLPGSHYELRIEVPPGTREGDLYIVKLMTDAQGMGRLLDRSARDIPVTASDGKIVAIANPADGPGVEMVDVDNVVFRYTDYAENHSNVSMIYHGTLGYYVSAEWGLKTRTVPIYFQGCEGRSSQPTTADITFTASPDVPNRFDGNWYAVKQDQITRSGQISYRITNTTSLPRTVGLTAKLGPGAKFDCPRLKEILADWRVSPPEGIGRNRANQLEGWRINPADLIWKNNQTLSQVSGNNHGHDPGYIYCSEKDFLIALKLDPGESMGGVHAWIGDGTKESNLKRSSGQPAISLTGRSFILNNSTPFNQHFDMLKPIGSGNGNGQQIGTVEGTIWEESGLRAPDGRRQPDEKVLSGIRVRIKGSGVNKYVDTKEDGKYRFQVPAGNYQITVVKRRADDRFAPTVEDGNLFDQNGTYSFSLRPNENRTRVDGALLSTDTQVSLLLNKKNPQAVVLHGARFNIEQDCALVPKDQLCHAKEPQISGETNGEYRLTKLRPHRSYLLTEVQAPAGYQLFPEPIHFTVGADGKSIQIPDKFQPVLQAKGNLLSVINYPTGELPLSGGSQNRKPVVAGLLLLAAATVLTRIRPSFGSGCGLEA